MKLHTTWLGVFVAVGAVSAIGCAHRGAQGSRSMPATSPSAPPPATASSSTAGSSKDEQEHHDEGMKVKGEMGTLEPAQVEGAFKSQASAVQGCYDRGLTKYAYLGGAMDLKVRVDKAGKVMFAGVNQPLGNLEVERCILEIAKAIAFPAPKGSGEAEFTYPFTFRGKVTVQEWGNAEVGEAFARNRAALDRCAKKGVEGGVPASMRVTFFVAPGGTVPSAGVGADKPIDDAYAQCITEEVARWKFADPRGRVARATYQF